MDYFRNIAHISTTFWHWSVYELWDIKLDRTNSWILRNSAATDYVPVSLFNSIERTLVQCIVAEFDIYSNPHAPKRDGPISIRQPDTTVNGFDNVELAGSR